MLWLSIALVFRSLAKLPTTQNKTSFKYHHIASQNVIIVSNDLRLFELNFYKGEPLSVYSHSIPNIAWCSTFWSLLNSIVLKQCKQTQNDLFAALVSVDQQQFWDQLQLWDQYDVLIIMAHYLVLCFFLIYSLWCFSACFGDCFGFTTIHCTA